MSNKFTNNVRTRLYKQGYQGFTKDDYTDAAIAASCEDMENPSKEELNKAVDYLKDKAASQLIVSSQESMIAVVQIPQEKEDLEEESLEIAKELPNPVEIASTEANVPDVGAMVTSKAHELGVVLADSQIDEIADSVDTSASTFEEILNQVEGALLGYADHTANEVDIKINQALSRVQQRVVSRHEQSREHLAQGLTNLGAALEQSRTQTKSQLANILNRLKIS